MQASGEVIKYWLLLTMPIHKAAEKSENILTRLMAVSSHLFLQPHASSLSAFSLLKTDHPVNQTNGCVIIYTLHDFSISLYARHLAFRTYTSLLCSRYNHPSTADMPLSRGNSEYSVGMPVSGFSELSMESRKAKFHVCLQNGRKIAVPISRTATVTELHVEAVRRASRAGILCNVDETLLEEDGGTILFGDDLLEDLFDLTQRNTLHLALSSPQTQGHSDVVRDQKYL